ncbi:MAG: hypothetical protein KatS3mg007_2336 [Thermoanaerobaculum sp.]|nr:MAG: hypothetical protein KatS3mg007_2336 [Thermoanaerobaculum sp.]
MGPHRYCAMIRTKDPKHAVRCALVRYATRHGIRAAAREFGCSRNTVRTWLRRFQRQGLQGLSDRSRAPHRRPRQTPQEVEALVIAQRLKTPGFGAARLVREFNLPVGKGAVARILRQHGLTRKPRKKHKKKRDLRAIKASFPAFSQVQMDTKDLSDIPRYWPQLMAMHLPRYLYTLREVSTGAVFCLFARDNTVTNTTIAVTIVLAHLRRCGVNLATVTIHTDHGTEFDGRAIRKSDRGFVFTIEKLMGAHHCYIPPGCDNPNPEVESFHATVEREFFDCHDFDSLTDFLRKAFTYQLYYNYVRKISSRNWQSPWQILQQKIPSPHPLTLALPPTLIDAPLILTLGQHVPGLTARFVGGALTIPDFFSPRPSILNAFA